MPPSSEASRVSDPIHVLRAIGNKPVHVLDIPDEYRYMDPALVQQIEASVAAILGL